MRGNRAGVAPLVGDDGSIPAYAGEPFSFGLTAHNVGVYPRVCGGTGRRARSPRHIPGLSPRMRGNPSSAPHCRRYRRSIPAYAGEPGRRWVQSSGWGVYPRVCGGTRVLYEVPAAQAGLSPRMRGNLQTARRGQVCRGSIPAYAGEPNASRKRYVPASVYPRVCGGTPPLGIAYPAWRGLSPRMRGNQPIGLIRILNSRSIPAYAGEPAGGSTSRRHNRVYPRVCGGTQIRHLLG